MTGQGFGPPDIYVNPESGLNFPEPVIVGENAERSLNISNIGADTLHISSITINDSQFKAVYDSSIHGRTPMIAPPPNDRSVFVSVIFTPEKAGEINAVLTIESNDPDSQTLEYPLTGIGRLPGPPQITAQPDTLDFGVVDLKAAKQLNFKIANRGESDLVISEIESDNNHFTVGFNQQQTIPGGDSLYFAVQFVPDSSLVYNGNLRIYSNDPEQSTLSMRLRGQGRPLYDQHIVVEPEELDFGEIAVNQSTTKYFWVYNTGEKPLIVSSITTERPEVTFSRTNFTVNPGAYQYVAATFKPKAPGTVFENINIINNDPDNRIIYVRYSGQGRELDPAYISTSASQNTISFGSVGLKRSASKYIKIYNTGEKTMTVSSVQTNNQQYTVNSSSFIVYPNSYRWLYVTFTPQAIGTINAELTIYSDASNAPGYIVDLTGTGRALTPPAATLSHSQYNFGEIGVTSERSFYLRVINSGEETLNVQLSHRDSSAFRYNINSFSILSGGSQYVLVFFRPESVGSYQDTLTLATNDPVRPVLYVALSGAGREMYAQKINVDPEILSFDSVGVGLSRTKSIWIANDGEKDLVIQNIYTTNSVFTLENQEMTINPGDHRYVYVTFKPLTSFAYNDTIFIENNDPDASVYKLPVTGFGRNLIDPRIAITPTFLEYGDVALNDSMIMSIYLTNTGERLLEISGITRTDRNNFWIPAEQQSFSIEPNQSKSIQVEFKPVEKKTFDDSLIVRSNDPSNPDAVVRLNATGRDSLTQQLTIQPDSLIFTQTAVGYSNTQYIQLTNSGEKRLVIEQIDNENDHFVLNFKNLALDAYESRELGITFTPSKLETYEDTLIIQSTDPEFPVKRIVMRGAGRTLKDPQLVTTPDSLAYGEVYLGASRQQGFTILNGGDLPLRIYGISTTDAQFTADLSDTFTVEGGSSRYVEVTFRPTSDGYASAIMTIQSNAGAAELSLSGTGVRNTFVPTLSVSPSKLNFETVAINIVHAKTLWISNIGYDTLRVSSINSSNPLFTVSASDSSFSLAQNSYRAVNVYFSADSVDTFTGTLYIMSNDPNQPELAVTISATSRNLLDPKIYVARDSLNFSTIPLNNKTAMNLMIQNIGEQRLDITDIAMSDSQFSVLSRAFSISSESYYYLPVYFQPDSVGMRTGMMTILNSDPTNDSLNIVLKGTGRNLIPQSIALSADSLNFGTTVINRSRSRSFYVINTGEVSLEVSSMTVASDQFAVNDDIFVVAPSDSHLVVVTYNPTRTDTINIDLIIRNNDSVEKNQILNLPVTAKCIKYDGPQIALNPTVIQYDDLLLGSRKERSFYVINNAVDSTLIVSDIRVAQYLDENYIITPRTFNVAAGDSQIVYVTFNPQYPGYFNTDLIIFHNDDFSENDRVKLYGRAIQNISGTDVLSSISGWQSSGYYPFSNVLKDGPDNAWFLKDFYLQGMPSSAMLYISFKDSLRLFINGSFVHSATSDTIKRVQSWNISDLDVSDYLNIGRNRITAYVSNQSGQSGFDCVLLVDGTPVIRHGGFYPDESALWYYYGISGVRSTVPVVYESRYWYSFEYGWTGLSDIVADWNFELGSNDTTYDNSDFGRRIETKNVLSVPGIIGKGIQFTGDNTSYVRMHANLDGIPRTLQLWLYSYESLSRDQVILNNGSPGYYGNGMYVDDRSTLWIYYPNGKFSTGYTLRPQKWYQLVVKYESDVIHVYVNRELIISYNYVRGLPQGKSYPYIGGNPDISTVSNGFFGIIDELTILNDTGSQIVMPDIVSISVTDTTGVSGAPFNLQLHVEPSPFSLKSGVVEYAQGGYQQFKESYFSVQDSNSVDADISIQIPANDVSISGLKCRIRMETDYGTKIFPDPASEDSLIWIPVYTEGESATVAIDTVFKMFSVPYTLDDKSVESVLIDNLGIYSPYDWRLFQWDASPEVKDYVEYSDQNWAEQPGLEKGRAVWIVGAQPGGFDAGSGWSPMDMKSFRIELKPGWNQISNPFPFPVAWEDVENKTDAISDLVYYETVNGIGYERNWQVMTPWEGYFVENKDSTSTRTLYLPPVATAAMPGIPLAKRYDTADSEALVLISVEASSGRYFDHDNVLGVKDDAAQYLDYYDMSEAPPIGKYVGLWVDNQEWEQGAGNYTADIRKSGSDGYTWTLHAESNLSGKGRSMELNIRQHTKIPEEWEIFLFDLESDIAVNLKEKTNYAIELLSEGVTARKFKLVAGTEAYVIDNSDGIPLVPATFALSQNYPNPFNPATTIEFTISRRTPVEIHIFNVLGQRVRVLMDDMMRAGRHRIVWDGLSDDGHMMTTGLYFIRLRAEGKHSVKKMMLVR
ncbi:MAG: choice-of-anchor D domain-containing protein [candidate division KSB1 bacterium]|nr:choice-of-anchor D domain-containing protein [candidate division KSB1 bacterium]